MKCVWGVLTVLVFSVAIVNAQRKNNVCPTFNDYYTISNNSRCWYDLAAEYDVVSNNEFVNYFKKFNEK